MLSQKAVLAEEQRAGPTRRAVLVVLLLPPLGRSKTTAAQVAVEPTLETPLAVEAVLEALPPLVQMEWLVTPLSAVLVVQGTAVITAVE
jgi:hypothetical protein